MESKLKPLRNLGALDGVKEKIEMPRDIPLQKTCNHKDIKIISSNELRCKCGIGWSGPNIIKLYNLLKDRST